VRCHRVPVAIDAIPVQFEHQYLPDYLAVLPQLLLGPLASKFAFFGVVFDVMRLHLLSEVLRSLPLEVRIA
jgi:hypothetical protein